MILTHSYKTVFSGLPKSRNFLRGVSIESLPYALRTALDLLGLTQIKDELSVNQVVSAFQNHAETLEDQIGRNPDDLIRDLNQFLQDGPEKFSRKASVKRSWWISPTGRLLDAGDNHEKFMRSERELFKRMKKSDEAVDLGWVRAGLLGTEFYFNPPPEMTQKQLDTVQSLYLNLPQDTMICAVSKNDHGWFDRETFVHLKSPAEIFRKGLKSRPNLNQRFSRQANQDEWVIHCHWFDVNYRDKYFFKRSLITPEEADMLSYLSKFPEGAPLEFGSWILTTVSERLGLKRNLLLDHLKDGNYYLCWRYKSPPPEELDLNKIIGDQISWDKEVDWRPGEFIPEDNGLF